MYRLTWTTTKHNFQYPFVIVIDNLSWAAKQWGHNIARDSLVKPMTCLWRHNNFNALSHDISLEQINLRYSVPLRLCFGLLGWVFSFLFLSVGFLLGVDFFLSLFLFFLSFFLGMNSSEVDCDWVLAPLWLHTLEPFKYKYINEIIGR